MLSGVFKKTCQWGHCRLETIEYSYKLQELFRHSKERVTGSPALNDDDDDDDDDDDVAMGGTTDVSSVNMFPMP